jgi:hypothetical protein
MAVELIYRCRMNVARASGARFRRRLPIALLALGIVFIAALAIVAREERARVATRLNRRQRSVETFRAIASNHGKGWPSGSLPLLQARQARANVSAATSSASSRLRVRTNP